VLTQIKAAGQRRFETSHLTEISEFVEAADG
jgi:hypothetical protein